MINFWTSPEINSPDFYHYDLIKQLGNVLATKPRVDHKAGGSGVHVLMVLARWLFLNQDWFKQLTGPKIIVEHDAYLNFMPESPYYQCWTKLYRNCNFDLIISSGKNTTNRLRDQGLPAVWVPKGTNAEFLDIPVTDSDRIGYFSTPIAEQETGKSFYFYKSRHEMVKRLESETIEPIACPASEFAATVSGYRAVVTNDATMGEPMAKQFECSALGAVVIREFQPELIDLGYKDRHSILFYQDFDHMVSLLRFYSAQPQCLTEMGANARKVAANHTWKHRAEEIATWIRPYIHHRIYI